MTRKPDSSIVYYEHKPRRLPRKRKPAPKPAAAIVTPATRKRSAPDPMDGPVNEELRAWLLRAMWGRWPEGE